MKHKGKISGLLLGNTVAVTEWIALQDVIAKMDARSFWTVLIIYIIQMIFSYYFGHRYDKKQGESHDRLGIKSNEFMIDFFGKMAALSERNTHKVTVYMISIYEWSELISNLQEKKINQLVKKVEDILVNTVRKSDVVARWEENQYVIIAVDNGYENSSIINRFLNNITKELENDMVNITFLFGAASYPIEGRTIEELLNKAKTNLYKNRDLKNHK
ncbi:MULTISPECIES: diguanylate cyclase domain-containing protein [unclassified Bacillus cereus group]|uniref:diguanylate cyclase domain-containing protein n=1 Tax=unclassified Bacillus cereus group TaxID=2750818 RepID=UPI001F5862D2|nr:MULTISPECIES: diguanylate cyclase [unclassified Bacillus cereus group]